MWRCASTFALVAGLAGCFSPSVPTGAQCAPPTSGSRCPSGQQCIAHDGLETCELPGFTSPDAREPDVDAAVIDDDDDDDDGILDIADNCPGVANLSQADEDGDHVGNVCDMCPTSANNTDGDGDGLGDACDPNPATAGDKLVMFEGFTGSTLTGWTSSGTFSIANGDGTLSAGDTATSMLSMPSPGAGHVEIRAAFVIDEVTATGLNLGSINLIERMQPNSDKSIACQLSGLGNGNLEELRLFDANAAAVINGAAHAFATGTEIELRLRRDGTSYECYASGPPQQVAGTATFLPALPRIGLRVRGAEARFHWVMITKSP